MPNLALYRKYRPENFSEVSGQETITRILKNQIAMDRVGHAYLFTGIRGTGKTTIAKIFARAVNCENPINGSPCGECDTCKAMERANNMDIIEIDAASNRGVDEIRNLRETVTYPPTNGSYKVYIVDEVHMLTKEAFNALLKTLEEPPEHAIFILATTEPSKLPETILSRCQIFNVKPISNDLIVERLKEITKRENVDIQKEALNEIALRSGNSMRDALSLLDQCIDLRLPGETITLDDVSDFLGISSSEQIERIIEAIANYDSTALTKVLKEIRESGREDNMLIEDLSEVLKELLYFKLTSIAENRREVFFKRIASQFSTERLYEIIDKLVDIHSKLKYNRLSQILTDTALLSLTRKIVVTDQIQDKPETTKLDLNPQPEDIPITSDEYDEVPIYEVSEEVIEDEVSQREVVTKPKLENDKKTSEKASSKMTASQFKKRIIERAEATNEALIRTLLESAEFIINRNGLFLIIEDKHAFMLETANFPPKLQGLVDYVMGKPTKVHAKSMSQYKEYLNNRKKKKEPSFESQVRAVVGEDVPYEKE